MMTCRGLSARVGDHSWRSIVESWCGARTDAASTSFVGGSQAVQSGSRDTPLLKKKSQAWRLDGGGMIPVGLC